MVAPLAAAIAAMTIFQFTQGIPPIKRAGDYVMNWSIANVKPDANLLIELKQRGLIEDDKFYNQMRFQGLNNERADLMYSASRLKLQLSDLVVLKWRKKITEEEFYTRMKSIGYGKSDSDYLLSRHEFYPSPADLINWQAKEVYETDAIEKYGLLDEVDKLDRDAFYKQGMTDEQIDNFWVAHWQHPPYTQIRTMLHRKLISEEDVYEWFRLVEIPPYWREKYTKIMYNVLTRVDVRRMYSVGVLSQEDVYKNYQSLGYTDKDALALTQFTIKDALPAERDLTRTMIEKGYEYGELNREIAVGYLVFLGYDEAEADYIIMLKDRKLEENELDDKIDTILLQFERGVIEQADAITQLDKLDISAGYREKLIAKVIREKAKALKLPSKEDLIKWLVKDIITEEEFTSYMTKLGYRLIEIALYLKEYQESTQIED